MSKAELKAQLLEAKRWPELVERVRQFVTKYNEASLRQMSEIFDCGLDILHNIGDAVEGLEIFRPKDDESNVQGSLRIRLTSQD